jgi:7,8-dihydro-6-hydroxymethylpterin dimethyltransferase
MAIRYIEKECEEHGFFKDLYWPDVNLYNGFHKYQCQGSGVGNPPSIGGNCPHGCGICSHYKTGTLIANIDLTNRCNMACPTCFANAGHRRYEPTLNQVRAMLQLLKDEQPVSSACGPVLRG